MLPYEHDGAEARAVIGWIAQQPWSDGRVGMYGSGYSAFAAWAAAKRAGGTQGDRDLLGDRAGHRCTDARQRVLNFVRIAGRTK